MPDGPQLFVVCRSCGSEVSPYVTECPYCGTRLRKRAPKLDGGAPPKQRQRPRLSPLRPGEMPGVSYGPTGRPYATIVLVALSILGYLIYSVVVEPVWQPADLYQRLAYAPFVYLNSWYQLAVLLPLGLFGWLVESRHGPLTVIGLFVLFGFGGSALAVVAGDESLFLGAPGAAAALLTVWVLPDLMRLRAGRDYDGDLLGVAVSAVVLALMPVATAEASAVATAAGFVGGLLVGLPLARSAVAR